MTVKKTVILSCSLFLVGFSYNLLRGQSAPAAMASTALIKPTAAKRCIRSSVCRATGLPWMARVRIRPSAGTTSCLNTRASPQLNVYDMIQKLMPATSPGTLTRPEAADLLAYILSFNKFPAGKTDLPSDEDSLKKLVLPKPAPPA